MPLVVTADIELVGRHCQPCQLLIAVMRMYNVSTPCTGVIVVGC